MPGSLGFGEVLVILLVALIVFGPKKLPEIGRAVGRSLREFRRATSDLKADLESDVADEPPTVKSDWQRRRAAEDGDRRDPAETAPDDAASMRGPDPTSGDAPD